MTPLEKMTEIHFDLTNGDGSYSRRSPDARLRAIQKMRAALLALAECELDADGDLVVKATLEAEDSDTGSTNEHILFAFKALLRSIANEGKDRWVNRRQ